MDINLNFVSIIIKRNLIFLLTIWVLDVNAIDLDEDSVVYNNIVIHPNRFTTNESAKINKIQIVSKAITNSCFAITNINNSSGIYKVEVIDNKGNLKYTFNSPKPGMFQVSNDGEFLSIYGEDELSNTTLYVFEHGHQMFKEEFISTLDFNDYKDVLLYNSRNDTGIIYYYDFKTDKYWEKKLSDEMVYPTSPSLRGERLLSYTDKRLYALNNKGEILWQKDRDLFNIQISDHGKYLICYQDSVLVLYTFDDLKKIWSKFNKEISGFNVVRHAFCQDERGLVYAIGRNAIKIYNLQGDLINELPIVVEQYFDVFELEGLIDIVVDGKKHHKFKPEEILK